MFYNAYISKVVWTFYKVVQVQSILNDDVCDKKKLGGWGL